MEFESSCVILYIVNAEWVEDRGCAFVVAPVMKNSIYNNQFWFYFQALFEELSLSSHLNVSAVLVQLTTGNCMNLARSLMSHSVNNNSVVMHDHIGSSIQTCTRVCNLLSFFSSGFKYH